MQTEKKDIDTTIALPLMEAFYTIQGEGVHQGRSAYFIRLAGCDIGCTWCDVKESWEIKKYPAISIDHVVKKAKDSGTQIVVVTGGEPLMWDLDPLCRQLKEAGLETHIETSGAHPLSGNWDWICFSPKRFKKPLPIFFEKADELKIVINHPNDFRWAIQLAEKIHKACITSLQPEWSQATQLQKKIVTFVKENPNWRISLQTHKYLEIP